MKPLATFKHISSKNANYGDAEKYLTFAHDEFTMKPTLDADGRLAQGAEFPKGTAGFAPCVDGSGCLVSADCAGGEAGVMLVTPGTDDAPVRIPLSGVTAEAAMI